MSDFDDVLTPLVAPGGPGAAVAIRQHGEVIHAKGYGLANVEWGMPIATDTVFRIGSVTKQFTAAAILKLAEAGKLGIDDPIERHLPDYPVDGRTITVRHLLNHTSGIKSYTAIPEACWPTLGRNDVSLPEMIDVFKDRPADFQPGERYLYNNSGYILLTAIIEAVSGKRFETFLRETFFAPLGMTRTSYLHDEPIVKKRAAGYALAPGRGLVNCGWLAMTWPQGAGALGSTVNDLLAWDAALHGGQVLSAESYDAMIAPGQLGDGSAIGLRPRAGAPALSRAAGDQPRRRHQRLRHPPRPLPGRRLDGGGALQPLQLRGRAGDPHPGAARAGPRRTSCARRLRWTSAQLAALRRRLPLRRIGPLDLTADR